ncbi:hypothetical protein [Legionella sp. km772]|uniref:hypothetical protein n=1 Tax=Legionella sp. km772 TaxID=2498111 RepID=UPI000F8D36F3|nr:hypothetical protein [Legionella sp. km772]RUR12705.1 hypothetical protein ELY15_04240 [Legionella sp. km772]
MRRTIESYVIYLKEDLKLADTLKTAKEALLKSITGTAAAGKQDAYFSEELAAYFVKEDTKPFAISAHDPSQVAVLKKILNSFDDAEQALRDIENLNIDPERGGLLFNAAKWVGLSEAAKTVEIMAQAAQIYYKKIHEVYAALQLLNHANADIQNIVGPHLQALMPRLALAQSQLETFTPSFPAESAGEFLAEVVKDLPKQKLAEEQGKEALSRWVTTLPNYFEELQKILAKAATSQPSQSASSAEEYQAAMLKRAQESKKYFDDLVASQTGLLATTATFIDYFKIMSEIALQSSKVLQTAPVSQPAYLEVAKKLEVMKHHYLPQVVAELEKIEESMGLKAGVLTTPAMVQMNKYYTQLASTVHLAAQTAGVLRPSSTEAAGESPSDAISPKPDLLLMEDEGFSEARRAHQEARLSAARIELSNTEMRDAAQRFFERLNAYGTIYQAYCKRSLANISQEEKDALMADYKKFQPHFAAVKPEIDKLIVDALTIPTGTTLVSRLLGGQYKQLWGSNHFTEVLNCQAQVVESIEQSLAQAQFKAKLIEKSITYAQAPSSTSTPKTRLTADIPTWQPVLVVANASVEHYHQKAIELEQQIIAIEKAKEGVLELQSLLKKIKRDTNIASLGEENKEALRKAYKKMQVPLSAMAESGSLHLQMVQSLAPKTASSSRFLVSQLMSAVPKITDHLDLLQKQVQRDKQQALNLENQARDKLPLAVKEADLERRTLFAMLHDLNLSQSVEQFISGNLQNYLKKNLSPVVLQDLFSDGKLELSKLPFTDLHQDSSEVVLYKQLINSLYHLHKGLKELEQINRDDPGNILTRSRYVFSTMKTLVMAINQSSRYLNEAAKNPGLHAIVQESNALLEPIRNLPFLGDYLQSSQPPTVVEKDVLTLWKEQQEVVRRGLSSLPRPPVEVEKPVSVDKAPKPSYVRLIAEALYKVPQPLERLNADQPLAPPSSQQQEEQINAFVERLNGLSFNPESIDAILAATSKLQKKLNEIGTGSRELVMDNLKEIRSEFGYIFMAAAAKAEFELGLKPGTYSTVVRGHFDRFYESLISNLPLEKDQTGLELIIDVSHTKKLLAKEKAQLGLAEADNRSERTAAAIFANDFKSEHSIYKAYQQLNELLLTFNDPPNQFEFIEFSDFREQALELYKLLQPFLVKANPAFTQEFLVSNAHDEKQLATALDEVFGARASIFKPTGPLTKIFQLALDDDFAGKPAQEAFLKAYQELQPYLVTINPRYDMRYFLRELQSPEDFASAAAQIIGEQTHLEELVEGIKKTKQHKVNLAQERVGYFDSLLKQQLEEIGPQRIEAFKQKVYDNYVGANVESFLALSIGDEQAALFVKHVKPDFLGMKAAVLQDLSIDEDIESVIGQAIDASLATILKDNTESFKELIFNNYIEKTIKNNVGDDLGSYKELFFKKIAPAYYAAKSDILNGLILDKNLSREIAARLDRLNTEVLASNNVLREDFVKLNRFAAQIRVRISQEQGQEQTPDRIEKLTELTRLLASLDANQVDADNPAKNLQQAKIELSLILYNSQLNVIKGQLKEQLGDYTPLFLNKVSHVYENNKSSIIQKALKNENSEQVIINELAALTSEIELNARALKTAFMELNVFSKQLKEAIQQEQALPDNPCRAKKVALMLKLQEFIHDAPDIHLIDSNWVSNKHKKAQDRLEQINEYDALIQINDLLDSLKQTIEKEESTATIKADRLKQVNELQQILYNDDMDIASRISVVMEKLREHSQENVLFNSGHNLIKDAFKNYFFNAQIKKEKEKLNATLGPFKERFMSAAMTDLMHYKNEIKAEIAVGMSDAKIEEIFAKFIPKVFAKHQALNELCTQLNSSLKAIDKLIADEVRNLNANSEVDLNNNPCHKEKLDLLTTMRDQLRESAFANDSLAVLKEKQLAAEKLNASLVQHDQLIELYNLLAAMKACVVASPASAVKDKKIETLDNLQKILIRKESPINRLIALEQENRGAYKILTKSADGFFMSLYKSFISLINKILGKEPSPQEKLASKYNENLGLFKENVATIKEKLEDLKKDDSRDNSFRVN